MDLDQTQAIYDYEEEEEEKHDQDKALPKKKEAAHLKVFSQQGFQETVFPIFQGDNFIGRDGKCNIIIPIKALSKKHACIEVQRDLHLIHDCESKNRTKKGKSFLKPTIRYELRHGDMLTLGDVRCQYLVELDTEEDEGDETGSETGSESMLPGVTTEEEQENDKPFEPKEAANRGDIPRKDMVKPAQDCKLSKPSKNEEDAYAADTDSDTDEERPLAAAVMPPVLYSSEDEREIPARQKATSIPSKQNTSMEGQTLAFGLGSPDNVFRNRESSGSGASHAGQTGSVPPTLMLSSESDIQSDDKADLSSDNKHTSPKHPGTRESGTQPTGQPTLLYDSGSDSGSPVKRPRHPEARVADKQDHPCEPTLLYGSESEDGSPVKRPKHPGASNVPPVLDKSDSEEGSHKASPDSSDAKRDASDNEAEVKDADATLPYAAVEMSSTDDEDETGTTTENQNTIFKTPTAYEEPALVCNTEDLGREETRDDKDVASDDYGEDSATQPYAADSNFESESEPIPFMGRSEADTSNGKQPSKPLDLEATQAYFVEDNDDDEEKEEERDSDSSDSQPLPIGPTTMAGGDDMTATLAYGLEATQAYNATDKDVDGNSEDERDHSGDGTKTPVDDLQATQAYGIGASDDDDDDDDKEDERASDNVMFAEQSGECKINRGDVNQPTVPYGLEATQAYGADHDETADEDTNNGDQSGGNKMTCLAATLPYGGDDGGDDEDVSNDNDASTDHKVGEPVVRQENQATLAYGLEETQAYDGDNIDAESAPSGAIEATQAYGIEEPLDEELQAQAEQSKTTTKKKVAFVSSFAESSEGAEFDKTEVDGPAESKGNKTKPSISTAASEEEELEDSELIQPQPHSKRGRKKPVVDESQEEGSEQASQKGKSQTEAVLTSSSTGTTEQIEGSTSGTPEDNIPASTPATRKGRRGAMRVTTDPGEGEEEEATSTRRRGRKGAKVSSDQKTDDKKGAATPGRKRGRQAAKAVTAAEASEDVSVEVEETPAPKSRRGRRGKMAQTEAAVSVSETPLGVHANERTGSEPTDSPSATALVAETPTVRRGGRGRGQKGATGKEMAQVVETKEQEEPVDSQPGTVMEATPPKGKGRGRRRGKKKQSLVTNEVTVEDTCTTEPVEPAISDEVQAKLDTSTPTRGKSRGKGRGKKTQSVSNESEVPETAAGNGEESHPLESPAVAATRQGRRKRAQPSAMEFESSEDASETLSNPGSREGSQTRKGRGSRKVSRESSEQGPSTELEVVETPAKKSRRGKEPTVSQSPSLRQGKLAGLSNVKVIFTGLVDKQGEKVVTSLGGELVDDVHSCTHLVTDKVRRTVKFLCGLASGQIIVQPSWLDACKRAKSFVDTTPFLVKDKDAEKQYKFDLQRSHEVALRKKLLEGYKVHVTKKVKPEPSQMKDIIHSAKGEFLSSMPRGKEDRLFVISCEEDRNACKKPLDAGIPVVSAEALLTGILRQQLDLEEYKLFADEETSSTSQDTSSSSGQSKRRREPSGAGSSSSTAETKTAGSKRRKR